MMSFPSTSSAKRTSMTNAKKPCEHCPECAKRNVQSRLRHYRVNLDSNSLKMCENDECLYPFMTNEVDSIQVAGNVSEHKNREKHRETTDFGCLNGSRCSSIDIDVATATNSIETDDILRELFVGESNGVDVNSADIASLVSMLENVTSDVVSNETKVSDDATPMKKRVDVVRSGNRVSSSGDVATDQINTKSKTVPSKDSADKPSKPVSRKSRAPKDRKSTPTVKESSKVDTTRKKTSKDDVSAELRTVRNEPTIDVTPQEPVETQITKCKNPLMRFLIAKQNSKVVSRSPSKPKTNVATKSVSPTKPAAVRRPLTKDVSTTNRMVTNWLSSANVDGRTTFPGYLSLVKAKDDGFVSEDSGIQSPQSLLSSESEPNSIR